MENKSYTLRTWAYEWLELYKTPTVLPQTADGYRQTFARILSPALASNPLTSITEMDLQRVLNSLQTSNYSKNTIEKARNAMRQLFAAAYHNRLIPTDPSAHLLIPKAPTKKVLPLTSEELTRVEDACYGDPLGHLLIFLLRTGLRRAELMALRWDDFDPTIGLHGVIHVRKSKTPAGVRTVPLIMEAADIIHRQPVTSDGYIFHGSTGQPLTEIVLRRLCTRIRSKAGVKHLTPHICRHTFVTSMCEQGVHAKAIAQIIGHAKASYVLDIYAQMERQALCEAIYVLEAPKDKT